MKESNFIIRITKFDAGYILNRLWRQIRVWGRLVLNPAYTKMIVTLSWHIGLIGHSGFTMAKVNVPCVFKNPLGKWRCRITSSLRTLLTCGALERRRPETVHEALTLSSSIDIINMSTLWRKNTEVCESELPNVPKLIYYFQNWLWHFKWYN